MLADCTPHMDQCRIVLLGDTKVGKTALINQLVDGVFIEQHTPTLLDSVTFQDTVDGRAYTIEVIDTSSDSAFELHRSPYIETADIIILVYSVLIKDSLLNLKKHVDEVVKVRLSGLESFIMKSGPGNEILQDRAERSSTSISRYHREVPIFLVGTHLDLVSSQSPNSNTNLSHASERVEHELVELVTEHCLRSVGFPIGSIPSNDDSNGKKKKNNAFQRIFKNIFKNRKNVEKSKVANGGRKASSALFSNWSTSSELGNCSPALSLPLDGTNSNPLASLPTGPSDRLPIFELSVKNSEQVSQLFLLILQFHILVKNAHLAGLNTPLLSPMFPRSFSSSSLSKKLDSPLLVPTSFSHAAANIKRPSPIEEKQHFNAPFLNDVQSSHKVANSETPLLADRDVGDCGAVPFSHHPQHSPGYNSSLHGSIDNQATTTGPRLSLLPQSHSCIILDDRHRRETANDNPALGSASKSSGLEVQESELCSPSCLQPHTPGTCGHSNNERLVVNNFPLLPSQNSGEDIDESCTTTKVSPACTCKPSPSSFVGNSVPISGADGVSVILSSSLNCNIGKVLESNCNDGIATKHATNIITKAKENIGKNISSPSLPKVLHVQNKDIGSTGATKPRKLPSTQQVDKLKSVLVPQSQSHFYSFKNASVQKGAWAPKSCCPNTSDASLRRVASSNDASSAVTPPVSPFATMRQRGDDGGGAFSKISLESREHSCTPSSFSCTDAKEQLSVCLDHACKTPSTRSANWSKDQGNSMGDFTTSLRNPSLADEDSKGLVFPSACANGSDSTEMMPYEGVNANKGEGFELVNSHKNANTSIVMSGSQNFPRIGTLMDETAIPTKGPEQPGGKSLISNISQSDLSSAVFQGLHSGSIVVTKPLPNKAKKVNSEPCSRDTCFIL